MSQARRIFEEHLMMKQCNSASKLVTYSMQEILHAILNGRFLELATRNRGTSILAILSMQLQQFPKIELRRLENLDLANVNLKLAT